jgi:hypothetical protein
MKNIIFLVLFFCLMVFGLKEEDDNFSKVDEDMIMVIADTIISERCSFTSMVSCLFLSHFSFISFTISFSVVISSRCQFNVSSIWCSFAISFFCFTIVSSKSTNRPDANFGKYSAPTQIQIKGTPIVDKKDANRFDRRSEVPINRGKNVNDICPLIVLYCIRIVIILQVYNIILEYKSAQAGDFNHYLYSQCIVYIRLDDAYNSIIIKYCNKIRLLFSRSVARYVLVIPMVCFQWGVCCSMFSVLCSVV